MSEIELLLSSKLEFLGRNVLRGGGTVKTIDAKAHAIEQYKEFNERRRAVRQAEADAAMALLRQQEKSLPKAGRRKKT